MCIRDRSRAYAATAYLRVADDEGKVTVNLVASKCRLAPPNGETIPRLKLLGALLGARLLNSLGKEYKDFLKIDAEFLWTDSSVVTTLFSTWGASRICVRSLAVFIIYIFDC